MKIFYIAIAFSLLSCNDHSSNKIQSKQDSLIKCTNQKIKLLQQRGDSIEKANVARPSKH